MASSICTPMWNVDKASLVPQIPLRLGTPDDLAKASDDSRYITDSGLFVGGSVARY